MVCLMFFVKVEWLSVVSFKVIGVFQIVMLVFFDWSSKIYELILVEEQIEVVFLIGDIVLDDKGVFVLYVYVVLGKCDGSVVVGYL